jgi:hypothetical protein
MWKVESPPPPITLLRSSDLPILVRVPHWTDSNVPALDISDSREDLFDIFPKDDINPIDLRATDFLNAWFANQAERLCQPHCKW